MEPGDSMSIPIPSDKEEWATSWTANIGGNRMNPGIRNLSLQIAKCLLGERMRG